MKLCSHLKISRHGIYYFRYTIPKVLRSLYNGKTELKYSLHTRNPMTAKREAYILSAKTSHIFHKAKQTMAIYNPNDFNINDLANSLSSGRSGKYSIELPNGLKINVDPKIPGDQAGALEMTKLLSESGAFSSQQPPETTTPPVKHTKKLSEGIKEFVKHRQAVVGLAEGTKKEEASKMNRFLTWTYEPNDPHLEDVSQDLIQEYIDYLINPDQTKHKGRSLSKTHAYNQNTFLNIMFTYLQNTNLYPAGVLPTANTYIFGKGEHIKTKNAQAYQPFNISELDLIFKPEHIKTVKKPHEFWVPLLGLYTGARIDELSQMFSGDIRQTNDGFWFLHIHANDGNSVKNESSKRRVPIHPDLISLGLLEYIEDVKAVAPAGRLFPYLKFCEKNGYGSVPSKAFARYLDRKEINITSSKKVFHSFRSTLVQLLQDNRVQANHIDALIGHATEGTTHIHYGKKTDADQVKDWVVIEIHFPFIENNIQQLKYTRGEYTETLKNALAILEREEKGKKAQEEREARATALSNAGNKKNQVSS